MYLARKSEPKTWIDGTKDSGSTNAGGGGQEARTPTKMALKFDP